jgi:hypothetical protein
MTNDMKPPPRLLDDPAVAPDVQEGLAELAAQQLPFDSAAGLSALHSALSGTQLGATTSSAATTLSTGTLVAGGVALLVIGAGMFAWLSPDTKTTPAAPPSTPALPPATQPVEHAPALEHAPSVAVPELAAPVAPEQRAMRSAPAESPLDREVAQMVRAKALLEDDPRAALGLLSRLEREHPRGALSEERAGLRVLALWKAGQVERAKTERELFFGRYPSSPMRERLAQLSEAP